MLHNSRSRSSLYSQQKPIVKGIKQDTLQLCQSVQEALDEASKILSHSDFTSIFEKTIKNLIAKAEVENPNSQSICLQTVKQCLLLYGGSLELNIRTLLLEILTDLNCNILQEIPAKLNKAKHIVLQTEIQYLLSKIFLLEEKYFLLAHDEPNALKCLKKCLDLNQEHMIEFMQESEQIRKQIVDYAIIAYYQYFKILKNEVPDQALDILLKACNAAKKNYGRDCEITKGLSQFYSKQQHILNSYEQMSVKSRAATEIIDFSNKKGSQINVHYFWEQQKIVGRLLKMKGNMKKVVSEVGYDIKLDKQKIDLLKSREWISVKDGEIYIIQDELLKKLGMVDQDYNNHKQMTTIEMTRLSRQKVAPKHSLSDSSGDDEDLFSNPALNVLKFPRAQSSRKFKQTQ